MQHGPVLRGFCKEVYVDIIIYYAVPPSSPCSPNVSHSGPCALNVLPLHTALQLRDYVTARSGPSGPQHARRSERSKWPATYLLTCTVVCAAQPVVCGTMLIPLHSFYIAVSRHPHTHPLCAHQHVCIVYGASLPRIIIPAQVSAGILYPLQYNTPRI